MTTPNNKSWAEEFDNKFEQWLEKYVAHREGNNGDEYDWYGMDTYLGDLIADAKPLKQFISSLLEQERKDERQRVLDECVEKCNFYVSRNGKMNDYDIAWNDALTMIVGELNQLKEDL